METKTNFKQGIKLTFDWYLKIKYIINLYQKKIL